MPNKNKKSGLYITTIRIVAILLFVFLIYRYFYSDFRPKELMIQVKNLSSTRSILLLIAAILLMPLNWVFESLKWKRIISAEYRLSHFQAFKSIFRGVSLGIITPGRVGEYGGRILDLPAEVRKYGILSTFICSLSQNFINVFAGLIAMFYVLQTSYIEESFKIKGLISAIVVLGLIVIVYFKLNSFVKRLLRFGFIKKRVGHVILGFVEQENVTMKWRLLYYSLLRYTVYLLQYLLILVALDINLPIDLIISGCALIFIIQTLIPLSPILQFTVRGSLAFYILSSSLGGDEEASVLASYAMWFINLLIPAMIGAVWLLLTKAKTID